MDKKKLLGRLAGGEPVYELPGSHLKDHSPVLPVLAEALGKVHSRGRETIVEEVDLGRVIGENIRVRTTDKDDIVYARRPGRAGLTRFVKNRRPEPCSRVVVIANRLKDGGYALSTAFVGTRCPAEPWDKKWADENSVPFWSTHALVWGDAEVVPGTETTERPW